MLKGNHHAEETKRKISNSLEGRHYSTEESRRKISLTHLGIKSSDKTKLKMSLSQKGHLVSEETKRKISLSRTGKHHTLETKQKLRQFRHTNETRHKLSLINKGKRFSIEYRLKISLGRGGDGIHFYNDEDYPIEFSRIRPTILKRDNYTCQYCFKFGNCVHHKDHNTKNNDPTNLLTTCFSCNSKEAIIWNKNVKEN